MNFYKSIRQLTLATSISLIVFNSTAQGADDGESLLLETSTVIADSNTNTLQHIEINRDQIIAGIIGTFAGQTQDNGEQLSAVLQNASATQLQQAQNATDIGMLNIALGGDDHASGNTGNQQNRLARIGHVDKDFTFTPVAPCRVADTRETGGGGQLIPNEIREYFVYGSAASLATQGGKVACDSPVGEPRGVMISITAVPVVGTGTINAFPANEAAPALGTIVFYQTGSQNAISSTSAVKTFHSATDKEIRIINKFGQVNLVIDVVGYFSAPDTPAGVEYASGNQDINLTNVDTTVRSISVNMPSDGHCVINASGYFGLDTTNSFGRCSITTGTTLVDDNLIIGNGDDILMPFGATKGFAQSAGTTTYRLVCDEFTGTVRVADTSLTAMCSSNRH